MSPSSRIEDHTVTLPLACIPQRWGQWQDDKFSSKVVTLEVLLLLLGLSTQPRTNVGAQHQCSLPNRRYLA